MILVSVVGGKIMSVARFATFYPDDSKDLELLDLRPSEQNP